MPTTNPLAKLALGKATSYPHQYNASLLDAVPRSMNRLPIGIKNENLPFIGTDTWTAYELSWLNNNGLPQVAIAEFDIPASSPSLIESKSFKLYLNSFNQHKLSSWQDLQLILQTDLSACAEAAVTVRLYTLTDYAKLGIALPRGTSIDQQNIEIHSYNYNPKLLQLKSANVVTETLHSDLLKSNCLITNQPDWGSVEIIYQGPALCHENLLRYIVSYRNHNEFHEQCVERIFMDIMQLAQPLMLSVQARYTRRGGLDINPWRSTTDNVALLARTARQ